MGMADVRDATASRMVVSSASESSLPTSAPVFLAYLPGLLISEGGATPAGCSQAQLGSMAGMQKISRWTEEALGPGGQLRHSVGSPEEAVQADSIREQCQSMRPPGLGYSGQVKRGG